jgi:hypothetical protein
MKKLWPPKDICSVQIEGEDIARPGADGTVEVSDRAADILMSHGFTDKDPEEAVGVRIVERVVRVPVEKIVEIPQADDTDPDSQGASDNIDEMKRGELTASLKALGVEFKMPITNDALKELLRGELARRFAPKPDATPPVPGSEQQGDGQQNGKQH